MDLNALPIAKDTLLKVAEANIPSTDPLSLPNANDNFDDFLSILYKEGNVASLLASSQNGEIVVIFQLLVHNFAKRAPLPFVSCIAPYSKAGIYQLALIDNKIDSNNSFAIKDIPNDLKSLTGIDFDEIQIQTAVLFPNELTSLLSSEDHEERINPIILAEQINNLADEIKPKNSEAIVSFLLQCFSGVTAPMTLALSDPSSKGSATQKLLLERIQSLHSQKSSSTSNNSSEIQDEDNDEDLISIRSVSSSEESSTDMKLSKEDKRLLMFLEARERSRDSSNLAKLSSILSEDRLESKKDGFMKHFPDHAKDTLIKARAGPNNPSPDSLSTMVASLLKKSNSEQMALRQILADLRKLQGSSIFDCHLDKATINSIFRKGEVSTDVPVISFQKATGINFPIFGTSGVDTRTIKSEGDLPFTISEAKSIMEFIESARNMKLFMQWINGSNEPSYAMIGLDNLISFLESNKGKIKRIAEQVPGVYAEIQIQCSNVWSSWFNDLCFDAPTAPPDFSDVLKPIKNNSAPPRTLAATTQIDHPFKKHKNGNSNLPHRQGNTDNGFNVMRKLRNNSPQLQMIGNDVQTKSANFGAKFGKGKVQALNIPQFQGKSICLKYHLLHSCKCKDEDKFYHGKLSNEYISNLLSKSASENLMISKQQNPSMKLNLPILGKNEKENFNKENQIRTESLPRPFPKSKTTEQASLLLSLVRSAISDNSKQLRKSKLNFTYTKEAAITNMQLLADNDFSIEALLTSESPTSLSPGSEFRPNETLFPLFKLHQNAEKLISIATNGVKYKFINGHEYSEQDRLKDLREAISTNINNKSAIHRPEAVEKAIKKDVERGLSFVIPLASSYELKDKIGFIPLGTAEQWSSDEKGNPRLKIRMTQDCSQERASGFSINKFIDPDSFECFFGFCLNRILLKLLALRAKYPNMPIGLSKHDLDSAYRRIHVFFDHAILQCWSWKNTAIINSRLPFGSSPAAPEFSFISDFAVDLAQWICDDPQWDPSTLHCSFKESLPLPEYTENSKASARPLLHDVRVKPINIDGFIDDLITVATMKEPYIEKAKHALPLALDAIFRPLSSNDEFERVNILSEEKNDSRRRLMYLNDISNLLEKGHKKNRIKPSDLEKIIGKLVHVSQIAKEGEFFLNRLRDRLKLIQNRETPIYKHILQTEDIKDLHLWIRIIKTCENEGRSLNRMLDTVPDFGQASDACEHGLGGWLNFGPAWRCQIPDDLLGILSINILESIATFWTANLCIRMKGACKILCKVDSTSARSWMRRNRFDPHVSPAHDAICREMGKTLLKFDSATTIQHIQGKSNVLADSLSRDSHLSSSQLTQALNQRIKSRLPENFKIVEQNPPELIRLLRKLASLLPSKTPTPKVRERSEILYSGSGKHSSPIKEKILTSFSLSQASKKEFDSVPPFATRTEMEFWERKSLIQKSEQEQSEIPSHKLERHAALMVTDPHS